MRVLAARFPDRGRASAVREMLCRRLQLAPADVDIAPLGIPGQESTSDTLLAGKFADEQASGVAQLVRECGGEIVANVDESWTRPRAAPRRSTWTHGFNRDGIHA